MRDCCLTADTLFFSCIIGENNTLSVMFVVLDTS